MSFENKNIESQRAESILNQKKYFDYGFKNEGFDTYEVQDENGNETVFSIVNKMINENIQEHNRKAPMRQIILNAAEAQLINPSIYKGDIIKFENTDNNVFTIYIGNREYMINIYNNTVNGTQIKK